MAYDDISAGDCSFMNASPSVSTGLSKFAATVHFMASKIFDISGFHVKSHNGVDSLCTFYKRHGPLVVRAPGAPLNSTKNFALQMSATLNDSTIADSLVVSESHNYNHVCAIPPHDIADRIDNTDYTLWDKSSECTFLSSRIMSWNVQTLLDFKSRQVLVANFSRLRFSSGCSKEARSKSSRSRTIGGS